MTIKQIISISLTARNHLLNILKKEKKQAILFHIESGGCNGFEYKFTPIDKITNNKNLYIKDDLKVEVCDKSIFHILGTEIDWKNDIMGQGFIFNNPISTSSCGCGTSFST
jgi:iron-sulfur cluster assembly accessory protein